MQSVGISNNYAKRNSMCTMLPCTGRGFMLLHRGGKDTSLLENVEKPALILWGSITYDPYRPVLVAAPLIFLSHLKARPIPI